MSKRLHKIEQLDSIRCIAAFMVILHHFTQNFSIGEFKFGANGVEIFFTISGFLITSILLEQKEILADRLLIVKNFIIKRILRLFPIYYLLVIFWHLMMVFGGVWIWDPGDAIYYYTYTTNILFFFHGFKGVQLDHTWTLAIEEQFYLVWPWVILFIPKKKEYILISLIIIFSLLFKTFITATNLRMLTFYHFDTLGIGSLLAYMIKYNQFKFINFINRFKYFLLIFSTVIVGASYYFEIYKLIIFLSLLLLSSTLVIGSYMEFGGIPGKILNNKWLIYLGKISYGLYLYHIAVPFVMTLILDKYGLQFNNYLLFFAAIALTILISDLSYRLIEKRFIQLKSRFDL